jgi:hypothetical protein
VTPGRPGRGPAGRGPAGRDDRWHTGVRDPGPGGVEIEDLPAQRVLATGRGRPGLGGALAVGAVVVVLAAGFGVLGGRPQSSPATAIGDPSSSKASPSATAFTGEPQVTPASPCVPPPPGHPTVLLHAGARSTPGSIELVDWAPDSPLASRLDDIPQGIELDRVAIRSDVGVDLWIVGGACAVAWTIDLAAYDVVGVLEVVGNPERDPGFASQNQFQLLLTPYAGRTLDLRARLVFPDFTAQATWPIQILPFTPPAGVFNAGRAPIPTMQGCDTQLTLGNGWETRPNPCLNDVAENRGPPTRVGPGQKLEFKFDHEDWQIDDAMIACGHFSVTTFAFDSSCRLADPVRDQFSFTVTVPDLPGVVALAISTCGIQVLADATNRLCGTWYVNLEVRGELAP